MLVLLYLLELLTSRRSLDSSLRCQVFDLGTISRFSKTVKIVFS